jgi:hypothetical protein
MKEIIKIIIFFIFIIVSSFIILVGNKNNNIYRKTDKKYAKGYIFAWKAKNRPPERDKNNYKGLYAKMHSKEKINIYTYGITETNAIRLIENGDFILAPIGINEISFQTIHASHNGINYQKPITFDKNKSEIILFLNILKKYLNNQDRYIVELPLWDMPYILVASFIENSEHQLHLFLITWENDPKKWRAPRQPDLYERLYNDDLKASIDLIINMKDNILLK